MMRVSVAVGTDVLVSVGVLDGAPASGAEFLGILVDFGVADGDLGG